jgi:hypothetical protein
LGPLSPEDHVLDARYAEPGYDDFEYDEIMDALPEMMKKAGIKWKYRRILMMHVEASCGAAGSRRWSGSRGTCAKPRSGPSWRNRGRW